MRIRTIGDDDPMEGWGTQHYFHVLTHNGIPLFAPQEASDDFWRRVVINLAARGSRIADYYDTTLQADVHLPYPGSPEGEPETTDVRRWEFYDRLERNRGAWNRDSWQPNEWRDYGWRSSASSWDTYRQQRWDTGDNQWGHYSE